MNTKPHIRATAQQAYDSVAEILASRQITAALAGQRIFTKEYVTFDVLPADSTEWDEETAGGAKLAYFDTGVRNMDNMVDGTSKVAMTVAERKLLNVGAVSNSPELVQKYMFEPVFGSAAANDTPEIYNGSGYAAQALAVVEIGGTEYLFVSQRCVATNYEVTERCRIVQFELKEDGTAGAHIAFSEELNIGHGGGLGYFWDGADLKFVSWMPTQAGHTGQDSGKGVSIITWRGAATSQSDVRSIQLFGWEGSGDARETYYHAQPTVSTDGTKLAILCGRKPKNGPFNPSTYVSVLVFDLAAVLASSNGLTVPALYNFDVGIPNGIDVNVVQGIAMDETSIAVLYGYGSALTRNIVRFFDLTGTPIRTVIASLEAGRYGAENILNHPTLGINTQMEPEGLAYRSKGELLTLVLDQWKGVGDVVTYEGQNYAAKETNTGTRLSDSGAWTRTKKPANRGTWNNTATYNGASPALIRRKRLWSIKVPTGAAGEMSLYAGIGDEFIDRNSQIRAPNSAPDIEFTQGDTFQVAGYSAVEDRHYKGFEFFANEATLNAPAGIFAIYSPYGRTDRYGRIRTTSSVDGAEHVEFGGSDAGTWGRVMCYGVNDTANPGVLRMLNADGTGIRINATTNGAIRPDGGVPSLGSTANRFNYIYLTQNPDVSSDERLKTELSPITEAETNAALEIASVISTYRLLAHPEHIQVGVGAQTVVSIMERHGLDPTAYAFVKFNQELDDDGNMHESYSVVYEQLLALVVAAMAKRLLA